MLGSIVSKALLKPKILIGLASVLILFFAYMYVSNLNKEVKELRKSLILKNIQLESKNLELETWSTSAIESEKLRTELFDQLDKSRLDAIEAKKVLDEHDFKYLLEKKPGLMSNRMRDGTDRVFLAIEREANR